MSSKNFNNKKYFIGSISILILMITTFVIFIFYIYNKQKEDRYITLRTESENIKRLMCEEFGYYSRLSTFIGKEITNNNIYDLKFILSVLSETTRFYADSDVMIWSSFNWIGNNYLQLVNSVFGIQKNPPDMTNMDYFTKKTAINNPWTLQVSHPLIGIPSGMWEIPVGMGIADKNGKFLGAVSFGFSVMGLENKIQQKLDNQNINFVIIDNDGNIILQSSGNIKKHDDDFYKKNSVAKKFTDNLGEINGGIKINDINYSYYHKMEDYPYIILTGFNQSFLDKEFDSVILPRILEFILIIIFTFIILLPAKINAGKKQ